MLSAKYCQLPLFRLQKTVSSSLQVDHGCFAGHGNVIQAVRLLEAETPFMQRSGAQRVKFLASTGLADELLLTEGAPARLLALLHRDGDQGMPVH